MLQCLNLKIILMKTNKVSYARDVEIMEEITLWQGEINTPLGLLLRKKMYACFNNLLPRVGTQISHIINDKSIKDKGDAIKQVLIQYNIYYK